MFDVSVIVLFILARNHFVVETGFQNRESMGPLDEVEAVDGLASSTSNVDTNFDRDEYFWHKDLSISRLQTKMINIRIGWSIFIMSPMITRMFASAP